MSVCVGMRSLLHACCFGFFFFVGAIRGVQSLLRRAWEPQYLCAYFFSEKKIPTAGAVRGVQGVLRRAWAPVARAGVFARLCVCV